MIDRDVALGILVGVLVGEGSFGGDGKQPQITLRMHIRHESLFRWLEERFGGRLYGPYSHGGREYYQWMLRGPDLATMLPQIERLLTPDLDAYQSGRLQTMKAQYGLD